MSFQNTSGSQRSRSGSVRMRNQQVQNVQIGSYLASGMTSRSRGNGPPPSMLNRSVSQYPPSNMSTSSRRPSLSHYSSAPAVPSSSSRRPSMSQTGYGSGYPLALPAPPQSYMSGRSRRPSESVTSGRSRAPSTSSTAPSSEISDRMVGPDDSVSNVSTVRDYPQSRMGSSASRRPLNAMVVHTATGSRSGQPYSVVEVTPESNASQGSLRRSTRSMMTDNTMGDLGNSLGDLDMGGSRVRVVKMTETVRVRERVVEIRERSTRPRYPESNFQSDY